MRQSRGQILIAVIIMLLFLAVIIPAMVKFVQDEARWSVKQGQNSNAFQLAEAAVERGYQKITESTTTWNQAWHGTALSGFRFNTTYRDLEGGTYTISVTSGPSDMGEQAVTILGMGRDRYGKEVRTIKAVYANTAYDNSPVITAVHGVDMSGNNCNVEWSPIMSLDFINIASKQHPSFWGAGAVDIDANGASPPNCDSPNCWWWHSYYSDIPPFPPIDFAAYYSSAQASGISPCGKPYLTVGNTSGDCDDNTGKPFYVTGDWTGFGGTVNSTIIVLGNFSWSNGKTGALATYNAKLPATAWKNYCNDWTAYQAYDTYAAAKPACFGSLSNPYKAVNKYWPVSPAVHGLVYVGKDFTMPNGGGNSDIIHGMLYIQGQANVSTNSHGHIYYDPDIVANIMMTTITLTRVSWQDVVMPWPAGL